MFPAVYDWEPSTQQSDGSRAMGWILMEFLPGVALDRQFAALPEDQKHSLVHQIAEAFSCIQRTPLPNKANLYGGLTIEDDTGIVSGQMTTVSGGPWPTYADFLRAKYASQLKDAQGSPALRGWNENGVRERIDAFLTSGLDSCLESAGCDQSSRVLVHGDLSTFRTYQYLLHDQLTRSSAMNNMLFDPETNRITGVLDFDFASVGHPCQEFFSSFHDVGGNVFGDEVPKGQIWDDALAARDILRPGTIRGMDTLKLLGQLDSLLCPFRLVHPVFLSKMSPGEMEEGRAKAEQALIECLDALKT